MLIKIWILNRKQTWIAPWKIPPSPIPSRIILFKLTIAEFARPFRLFVTSYTCNITSPIPLLHLRCSAPSHSITSTTISLVLKTYNILDDLTSEAKESLHYKKEHSRLIKGQSSALHSIIHPQLQLLQLRIMLTYIYLTQTRLAKRNDKLKLPLYTKTRRRQPCEPRKKCSQPDTISWLIDYSVSITSSEVQIVPNCTHEQGCQEAHIHSRSNREP